MNKLSAFTTTCNYIKIFIKFRKMALKATLNEKKYIHRLVIFKKEIMYSFNFLPIITIANIIFNPQNSN